MTQHKPSVSLPFSQEFLTAIGSVVTLWAFVETEFDGVLSLLCASHEAKALAEIPPRPFNKRLKLFRDAARVNFQHCPPLLARFQRIAEMLRILRKDRDFIAHGRWAFPSKEDSLDCYLIQDGNWSKLEQITFQLSDITSLNENISYAAG
jgi:hypothetical protein